MPFVPPWIRPADPAEQYAKGYGLGQRDLAMAQENYAMQQRGIMAAQEEARRSQEMAQREAMAQAELAAEIEKQKQAAQAAQEELAIKRQVQTSRDRAAAMEFAAGQALQSDIAGGMDPAQAIIKHSQLWAGRSAPTAAAFAGVTKAKPMPFTGEAMPITAPTGEVLGYGVEPGGTGRGASVMWNRQVDRSPQEVSQLIRMTELELRDIARQLSLEPPEAQRKQLESRRDELQSNLNVIRENVQEKVMPKSTKKQAPAKKSIAGQKAEAANALAAEHPDWTRQQILDEVKKMFSEER